jgi:hypothetical protein
MRNASRYMFKCAYDAHVEITRIFDFVQPTIIALWNLRWQVGGFLSQVPGATSDDLANRFALGSGMRGGELKRAAIDTPWDRQKSDFAGFILITIIAVFEEYTARIAEAAVPAASRRKVSTGLQFPTKGSNDTISKLTKQSPSLQGVFLGSCQKNRRYAGRKLNNLLICYRFFKAMRNMLAHNGGEADQETVNAYNNFKAVDTIAHLGLRRKPRTTPSMLLIRYGKTVLCLKPGPSRKRFGQRTAGQGRISRCIWIILSLRGSRSARRWEAARPRHDSYVQVAGGVNPNFLCLRARCDRHARLEQKFQLVVRLKIGRTIHGSNNALPEMRKTNGIGSHHLRPHRPPMHRL